MSHDLKKAPPATPKTERWLLVMALAFAPTVGALFVPDAARIPLLAISALTFIAGFVLMIRQSKQSHGNDSLRRLVPPDSE